MEYIYNAVGLFIKGGPVMYPLLFCSVIVVTIAVDRFCYFRRWDGGADKLIGLLTPVLIQQDWAKAAEVCRAAKGAAATVLTAGIERVKNERQGLENILEGEAAIIASNLRNRLDYLDTIVTLAPLLGLLGTVMGMISAFSILNIKAGQTQAITGGVGEALVATAFGLCVAILALAVHSYFKHWLDGVVTDMEKACIFFIDKADQVKKNETA